MPVQVSYPGVYIEELPSQTHTATAATTSATAFADFFPRGPVAEPVHITNFRDFTRIFGGLHPKSEASYGLMQFFDNGGADAWVVRLTDGAEATASVDVSLNEPTLDSLAQQADDAAGQADTDAGKASDAAKEDPTPEEPGKPALDAAEATRATADDTSKAAQATAAIAQLLAEQIEQASAVSGAVADATKQAAQDAADKAAAAKDAADAAKDAADKAKGFSKITDDNRDDAQQAVQAASEAAAKAAKAAREASDAANTAQLAGENADQVGEGSHLTIRAANPGAWGNRLRVAVLNRDRGLFDLQVQEVTVSQGVDKVVDTETFRGLTVQDKGASNFAPAVVNAESQLVRLDFEGVAVSGTTVEGTTVPAGTTVPDADYQPLQGGKDGGVPGADNLFPVKEGDGPGLKAALQKMAPSIFNLLCLPLIANYSAGEAQSAFTDALELAAANRAFFIADIPASIDSVDKMKTWMQAHGNAQAYSGAVYFPRLTVPDPLQAYRPRNIGNSGTLAGIYARTDSDIGVWKAPAGTDAVIEGANIVGKYTDADSGELNPLGVNVLRSFSVYGNVVWGARTLAGADLVDSQWKYVNVRRLADFVEDSLFQSLKWVVFEDNDERLWAQIRTEVGSFMSGLFADGAFAGATPDQAYLVAVDSTTTTPADIDKGIVNILVGFAPVKPAEFVILKIEQLAGQTA